MEVYKFGGTSVGTAGRISDVCKIITNSTTKIVVLSANGKSTDFLEDIIINLKTGNTDAAGRSKVRLHLFYTQLINALFQNAEIRKQANNFLTELMDAIQTYFDSLLTTQDEHWIISRGEIFSTTIFSFYLHEKNISHELLHATDVVHVDKTGRPDLSKIRSELSCFLQSHPNTKLIVTQGFLCSDHQGNISTLGRGGSDFTASLLAATSGSSLIQIWSDVPGFLNNDPDCVRSTLPLSYLSFDEAAELAYFGARILHPSTLHPAKEAGIPVILKNALNPEDKGTMISTRQQNGKIKAVASKDNICSITIHSDRMLLAYGFLRKVFEVFETHETSVDMVTTSEVSVAVTIDNTRHLENILGDLAKLGDVSYTNRMSIVCVVGDSLAINKGNVEQVFAAVSNIPVRMISYGAAKNSISFLVETKDKVLTLEALNSLLTHPNKIENQYV